MNKKLASAVSGGAVLMLVLSGCGGDDGDEKANAWAKKVCDKWSPELKKIETAHADMKRVSSATTKPDEVQKTDSAAFQTQSDAYKAMSAAVSSAGAPPTKDGQASQTAAVQGFDSASKAYADLKAKIDGLDPKEQTKFADALSQLSGGIAEANKGSQAAYEKLTAGDLEKAIKSQKGCKVTTPAK
ncbi:MULTISPECIES: small secreted protein [unclassified Streptomyces]|uniref:small secreted protein n=1 Tax=unclassified Streptomyces TaxID=2593676 RepID=UPI0034109407